MSLKRVAHINTFDHGSTGNIALSIINAYEGDSVLFSLRNTGKSEKVKQIQSSSIYDLFFRVFNRLDAKDGFRHVKSTEGLIEELKKFNPDIIHLHNLHGNYVNVPLLFKYIKENNIKVIWSLHDCWSFTGRCPHFDSIGCHNWKEGCHNCPYPKLTYPAGIFDKSKEMQELKKEAYGDYQNLSFVSPSKWLAGLVKESFLKDHNVQIINNGIDLSVFTPTESDFRKKYHLEDKFVVLGVSFDWRAKKGLEEFIELANSLQENYQIVLVGTNDSIDKKLPKNIISIHRTQNQKELAEIYSAADLFVNPTREDTYPTVNMEAIACGTPVLTYQTGGSPEILGDKCGIVTKEKNAASLKEAIEYVHDNQPFKKEDLLEKAKEFDKESMIQKYIELYK